MSYVIYVYVQSLFWLDLNQKMNSNFISRIDSDMYSFDVDEDKAMETYEEVCLAYERIFKRLDLPAVKG